MSGRGAGERRPMMTKRESIKHSTLGVAAALAVVLAGVTGCHKDSTAPNPASLAPAATTPTVTAPTASLVAEPTAIDLGQSVVLNWRTTNATDVEIEGI